MRRLALPVVLAAAIAGSVAFDPAWAESSADPSVRDVIASQIDAFRVGDDDRAFSFASPNIQAMFGTSGNFMAMVKSGYQPVYAPQNFTFGRYSERNGTLFQEVMVTGPEGREWVALYTLERLKDGSTRITGVRLARSNTPAI